MRKLIQPLRALALLLGIILAGPILAQGDPLVALNGYDTVSYFIQDNPVKGHKQHSMDWDGMVWQFSSMENLKEFQKNPSKYTPQYGGYCAFAVAHDSKAPGDPHQWHIHKNKLYLNLSAGIQKRWLTHKQQFISQADQNWPRLK